MISIKSFIESSFLDWDGKISSVIFLPNCNLRCIYCQNNKLVISPEEIPDLSWEKIKNFIFSHKNWIDGICITGGEPCLHEGLEEFIKEIKEGHLLIKLDTNGCYPEKVKKIINQKLVDYVALDIKAPLNEKYKYISGKPDLDIEKIRETINILHQSNIGYEFRTTIIPGILGLDEIINIVRNLNENDKYFLQNFKPENALNESLRNTKPYKTEDMIFFKKECEKFVKNCKIKI